MIAVSFDSSRGSFWIDLEMNKYVASDDRDTEHDIMSIPSFNVLVNPTRTLMDKF